MIKRAITALVLLAIAAVVVNFGGLALLIWVWIISIAAAYEMFYMLKKRGVRPFEWSGYFLISLGIVGTYFDHHFLFWGSPLVRVVALAILGGVFAELSRKRIWVPQSNILATARIVFFILFTFTYIFLIRAGNNGLINLLFCLLVVWASDSMALLGGRWIGRTQLSQVSPNKTLEGSLIGLLFGLGVAWVYMALLARFWDVHLPFLYYSLVAIGVAFVSQIGDLHESLYKRHFGVKDSSTLLPGHGGVYDRADSTLFIAPLAFYLFNG